MAGACCFITFSNILRGDKTNSVTLNINSTGSKTDQPAGSDRVGYGTNYKDWSGTRYSHDTCLPLIAWHLFAVYDGSIYRVDKGGMGHYDDYSD